MKVWEIRGLNRSARNRSVDYDDSYDGVDECDDDSYDCGYEDGYKAAMMSLRRHRRMRGGAE